MKKSKVGIVAAAILMVVGGVGFGIAQAGGTHSEQPVLSVEDMEALDQSSSSSSYIESRPVSSFEDQEATQVAKTPAEDVQMNSPIETGSLPDKSNTDSSIVEIGGVSFYRVGGKLYGPP